MIITYVNDRVSEDMFTCVCVCMLSYEYTLTPKRKIFHSKQNILLQKIIGKLEISLFFSSHCNLSMIQMMCMLASSSMRRFYIFGEDNTLLYNHVYIYLKVWLCVYVTLCVRQMANKSCLLTFDIFSLSVILLSWYFFTCFPFPCILPEIHLWYFDVVSKYIKPLFLSHPTTDWPIDMNFKY